jgi:hypothetical protein
MPHRRAINIGQIPPPFCIKCNKYYINKSHSIQIAITWDNFEIPRVGMQLMI